ncbi:XRE family transcriptional regulator [Achromobacter seleniivolatilans]|uniref:XRE family transcriptional regulator n=1 Tax=Achromobacter seleniivolatilans TaxID=3047478 RepID=A0ABY9LY15_9BURK|nr:XRE family transcriptional regulator [Achromobacter sp. R39]WMD19144.1 XRE family transcriptional regulator [Achromobacter sp. R39]
MTYTEFLAELGKAGLTVRAFAKLIGMNRNSVSNYAGAGEVPGHLAVIAALLAEMSVQGLAFHDVLARIDLTPKRPRGAAKAGRFGGEKQNQLELDP